jgi:hypothetical protein
VHIPFVRATRARLPGLLLATLLTTTACGSTTPSPSSPGSTASPGAPAASIPVLESAEPTIEPETTTATSDQVQALRDAALTSVETGTVRMVYSVVFEGATTVPDGTFLTGRGQTSFEEPRRAHLSANLQNESFNDWEMIVEGRELYLKGDVVGEIVPAGRWLLVDLDSDHRLVSSFAGLATGQNDSSLALWYVLGAAGDVQIGEGESIDGQDTTRYALDIDLEEARRNVPESSAGALDDNLAALEAGGISTAVDAEVWVGRDGRVVKTEYVYTLGAGEGGGKLIGTYVFSDYGAPMDDVIPADAEVLRLEDAVAE